MLIAKRWLVTWMLPALIASVAFAQADQAGPPPPYQPAGFFERETLTDDWFGLADEMADLGLRVNADVTQVYQIASRGPVTHRRAGRYAGRYDIHGRWDLETAFGLTGSGVFIHVQGGWSDGLNASSVGAIQKVNEVAFGHEPVVVTELFWKQCFFDERLRFHIGKIDLTGNFRQRFSDVGFDTNRYANDETTQFLNAALVNNPAIPFPSHPLAVTVMAEPVKDVFLLAAVSDAEAQRDTSGFTSAFSGQPHYFFTYEAQLAVALSTPNGKMPGGYRVGFWHETTDKPRHDGSGESNHDVGFYTSINQMVFKEIRDAPDDKQGAGVFGRLGFADGDVNDIHTAWSAGGQYRGLIPSRDDDVLGFGVAQSLLARGAGFSKDSETVFELYYKIVITPWLEVSPSIQHVINPGAAANTPDATVFGIRVQLTP